MWLPIIGAHKHHRNCSAHFEVCLLDRNAWTILFSKVSFGGSTVYYRHSDILQLFMFRCQEVLLESMVLGENIARNVALRENVFMMAVCVDLRIPLFLVGKPGSSKSLAKAIVADSMRGQASQNDLLKSFKQVSFQVYSVLFIPNIVSLSGSHVLLPVQSTVHSSECDRSVQHC